MLCPACREIFSRPRKLSYGAYYPWDQTKESFLRALREGCHLCNVIEETRSYENRTNSEFPHNIRYAFLALSEEWARHGKGSKWLVPKILGNAYEEVAEYRDKVERDPTANSVAHLLTTDSDKLINDPPDFWLILELCGPGTLFALPLEFGALGHIPEPEQIAQTDLNGQTSSGSKENLQLARAWLQNCKHDHSSCRPRKAEFWLPTRLLYVGSQDMPALRLILSSSISVESEYAALSHRWGTNKGFVLTSANMSRYLEDIPVSSISSTLQDAVETTRGLGLEYLWVDSMCIVQDDPDDWASQSATMARVYGLSTCTIAAAHSGSGDAGCFATRNQYRVRPCSIPNPFKTDSKYSFFVRSQYLHRIHEREVKESLWYNRGWVFQERTLSRRLLIFGKTQMLWACEELQAAETWPCGKTSKNYIDRFESFEVEKSRFNALLDRTKGISTDHKSWWTFIKDYTGAKLTKMTDRLVALQGLASQIEVLTDEKYCAGFWLNHSLPSSLLWTAESLLPYPAEYRAPSWSWASIDGSVKFNNGRFSGNTLIRVLGTKSLSNHPRYNHNRYSQAPGIALQLAGRLLPVILITASDGLPKTLMKRYVDDEMTRPLDLVGGLSATYEIEHPRPERSFGIIVLLRVFYRHVVSIFRPMLGYFQIVVSIFRSTIGHLQSYLDAALRLCCWGIVDIVEFRREQAIQKELAKRRKKVADGLAQIGTPQYMNSLNTWNIADFDEEELTSPYLKARCHCDAPLAASHHMNIFALLVVQNPKETYGLLVRLIDGTSNEYQRIGTFELDDIQLRKFSHISGEEEFLLI